MKYEMDACVKMLVKDEGFKPHVYDDSTGKRVKSERGNFTIGVGINLEQGISYDEAIYLLTNRIDNIVNSLSVLTFYDKLSLVRRLVLINLAFNNGIVGLHMFKKTLAAIEAGEFEEAANEILDSKAARELPFRYARLAMMMKTDKMVV